MGSPPPPMLPPQEPLRHPISRASNANRRHPQGNPVVLSLDPPPSLSSLPLHFYPAPPRSCCHLPDLPHNPRSKPTIAGNARKTAAGGLLTAAPRHGTQGLDAFQLQKPDPNRGCTGITVHDTKGQQFFTEEEERCAPRVPVYPCAPCACTCARACVLVVRFCRVGPCQSTLTGAGKSKT